jgi:hypothetical protein
LSGASGAWRDSQSRGGFVVLAVRNLKIEPDAINCKIEVGIRYRIETRLIAARRSFNCVRAIDGNTEQACLRVIATSDSSAVAGTGRLG